MSAKSRRLTRAVCLLWGRLGSARVYVILTLGVILVLACIGALRLFSRGTQTQSQSPVVGHRVAAIPSPTDVEAGQATSISSIDTPSNRDESVLNVSPEPRPPVPTSTMLAQSSPGGLEKEITIMDVSQTIRRGRRGETLVVATVGMVSRSNVEKGGIEIHVLFFDRTARNEIRPTEAQVTYQWLTPVRNWDDPAPKYLAATYLQRRTPRRSKNRLRYGGFVVRVYVEGKLQDERSKPDALIGLLGSGPQAPGQPNTVESSPMPSNHDKTAISTRTTTGLPAQIGKEPPAEKRVSRDSSLPYGKPVPGKPGFVSSPFDTRFIIDVRGFPPGTLVNDPNTDRAFRVP